MWKHPRVFLPAGYRSPLFYGIALMDEESLVDRCRSKVSRIVIGLRIRLHRARRRLSVLLSGKGGAALRMVVRVSQIGRVAGWARRHPRWAALELAGLLLAVVFGFPTGSKPTDAVDIEETAIQFDDVELHKDSGGGFAEQEFHSPPSSKSTSTEASASKLEGPSLAGGPLLVPDPPSKFASGAHSVRFHPATASSSATPPASRFVQSSRRTDGKRGAWLTGTIESVEPVPRTAGRSEFNPIRRQ